MLKQLLTSYTHYSREYESPECDIIALETGSRIMDLSNTLPTLVETEEDW